MRKRFDDLTIEEAERLIKCRDEDGENLCRNGCPFHILIGGAGCCWKNGFLGFLFQYCQEKNLLIENDEGEWEIEVENERK